MLNIFIRSTDKQLRKSAPRVTSLHSELTGRLIYAMKENGRKQAGVASPCAACKLLRRRCSRDCVFGPHFPADEPQKFASVHKVFGASNVSKMLQELPEHQRSDAVSAMVYEANARVRDPVYGCVGAISSLQQQVDVLQTQLALAQAEVVQMRMRQFSLDSNTTAAATTTASAGSFENASLSSTPYQEFETSSRSRFTPMDMIIDHHATLGESLWSC